MRPSVGEPLRMRLVGGVKDNLSGDFDALTVASVTVGGGKHPNARMMMLVDVPIEELFAVCGHLVERLKLLGPVRPVLQRSERGLGVGVVVGHPRSRQRATHTEGVVQVGEGP